MANWFVKKYLFLAALGLHCCTWASSISAGFSLQWRLLLQNTGPSMHGLQQLLPVGSVVCGL